MTYRDGLVLTATVNVNPTFTGHIMVDDKSYDIAAPRDYDDAPAEGSYMFVRAADLRMSRPDVRVDYGSVALFFVNIATKDSLCIHGGITHHPGEISHPDSRLSLCMRNEDLVELWRAIRENRGAILRVEREDIGWLKRLGRSPVFDRGAKRFRLTQSDKATVPDGQYDNLLANNELYWLLRLGDKAPRSLDRV